MAVAAVGAGVVEADWAEVDLANIINIMCAFIKKYSLKNFWNLYYIITDGTTLK